MNAIAIVATNLTKVVKAIIPREIPIAFYFISSNLIEAPIPPNRNGMRNNIVHFKNFVGWCFPQI